MKTQNRVQKPETKTTGEVNDFNQLSEAELIVEHKTIPGFLSRIPHRWDMDEVARFGAKVGKAAESLQVAYVTTVDRSLGVIRVFPLPLLERVYTIMAGQFGWPKHQATPQIEDRQLDARRANERTRKHLEASFAKAHDPHVSAAAALLLDELQREARELSGGVAPVSVPPLRAV